jgi:hypothetical protein
LTGVVSVVLLVAAVVVYGNYEYLPSGQNIKLFLEEHATRVYVGGYLGLLSAFFLLWFVGTIRTRLRVAEGQPGRVSALAFGGGVAAATVIIVGFSALVAAGQRAGAAGGIGTETATALFDLYGQLLGIGAAIALAVLLEGTAVVSFRTGVLPRWLAWVSGVVALGLLTPISYIFLGVALIWLVVVSILFYVRPEGVEATT